MRGLTRPGDCPPGAAVERRLPEGSFVMSMCHRPGSGRPRRPSQIALAVTVATVTAAVTLPAGAAYGARPTTLTGKACTIVGTKGNDRLVGTRGYDVICGLGGNDTISGGGGNDVIDGGPGNDIISGGSGNDTLVAGDGADRIGGGDGSDRIDAGSGSDTVDGDAANDIVNGSSGNDIINGSTGNDRLDGSTGDDTLNGGPGADFIEGGPGVNKCTRDTADTSPRTSCTDMKKPVLDSATVQWVGGTSWDNSTDHPVRLRVRITDDRSGLGGGTIDVSNGVDQASHVALGSPTLVSGTATDGIFEFTGLLPAYSPPGIYRIFGIAFQDRVGHFTVMPDMGEPNLDLPTFTLGSSSTVA